MAELTVIEGGGKDDGESVVSRWEKGRGVKVWDRDRRVLVRLIDNAIAQAAEVYECDGTNCPPRAHDHKVLI